MNMVLLAAVLWTTRRLGLGVPAALSRLGSALALVGLFIVLVFLTSLLFEGLTDRLPEWTASLGTLVASMGSLLVLPIGLMLMAVATLRDERLPAWARPLPLLATFLFMAVPIAVAIVPEGKPEGQVAAVLFAVAGVTWSSYVFGIGASLDPSHSPTFRREGALPHESLLSCSNSGRGPAGIVRPVPVRTRPAGLRMR
ncbi:MAG: hypothetical protein M3345_07790 [Actinomycetota bacterium]|nr:hypothetical protein [Actinomycetota bacterium]